jgi:uncharacterized protein YraI
MNRSGELLMPHACRAIWGALVVGLLLGLAPAVPAVAQDGTERVAFAPGSSSTTLRGTIVGSRGVSYVLRASRGQRMTVGMTTTNPSTYFNILPSGSVEAIFNGSVEGARAQVTLPSGGDWVVQVYLTRNAARRGEMSDYTLSISIEGGAAQRPPVGAAAGGRDWWAVTGVGTDDGLNVREGPSTNDRVVARVANGASLRKNGDCVGEGHARWCPVAAPEGSFSGWAAARFLRDAGAPPSASAPVPEGGASGPDWWAVSGVGAGDSLNLREGPSTNDRVVGRVANGAILRNGGCVGEGRARWCQVSTPDGRFSGWAAGRFLQESGAPSAVGDPARAQLPDRCRIEVARAYGLTFASLTANPAQIAGPGFEVYVRSTAPVREFNCRFAADGRFLGID